MKRRLLPGALLLAVAVIGAVVLFRALSASRAPVHPNVVVYLVDTLRADHLGIHGYERATSPRLDEWATEGIVFEHAYSPTSWTRPAMVSLFSGRDASSHLVEDRLDVIPDDLELLSERLQEAGYTTWAAVTNPNVLPQWGFDRGFDRFEDLGSIGHVGKADEVTDFLLDNLDELAANQPFLLYVHLIDPHAPYDPPAPYDERFPRSPALPATLSIGSYDGEIAFVDEQFGRFIEALEARDLTERSVFVYTSDHGEELLDHGAIGHGGTLYEEVVQVPLVLRLPDAAHAGTRISSPVSLIDIAPTILGMIGRSMGPEADGRDLMTLLPRQRMDPWADRDLFLSLYTTGPDSHAVQGVISGWDKYLRRTRPRAEEQFFRLDVDPREQRNRNAQEPEDVAALAEILDAHLADHGRGVQVRVVGETEAAPSSCELVLTTTGRFMDVQPLRLEADDRLTLEHGDRR